MVLNTNIHLGCTGSTPVHGTMNLPVLNYYPFWILVCKLRGGRIWYLIPYEICTIEVTHKNYIKSKLGYYVYGRAITGALRWLTSYNFDQQRYYDRYFLNITTPSDRPKCPNCDKYLNFKSVSHGYGKSGIYNIKDKPFCSTRCKQIFYGRILVKNINTVSAQAKGRLTQFVKYTDDKDICRLYIAYGDWKYFKFGITARDLYNRSSWFKFKLIGIHTLAIGNKYYIARLEQEIKLHFNQTNEYLPFSKLTELLKLIKSYRKPM